MIKKKKIKEKIKAGVREIKKKVSELEELELALDDEWVNEEGFDDDGIFDEDLMFVEGEPVGEFDISDNMLTAAPAVESWAGQNLEDTISKERIADEWKTEDDFVGGDIYNPSSGGGVYGAGSGSDVYGAVSGGGDAYAVSGDGAYNTGSGEGGYAAQGGSGGIKSYADVEKDRRSGKSMLEVVGFEDKEKSKQRESQGLIKYQASGKAA